MGIFDFVKDAGDKIFNRDSDEKNDAKAASLKTVVSQLGLNIQNLNVAVDDHVATLQGTATSQADKEKAILVVGNTAGISKVNDQIQVKAPAPQATMYTVKSGDTLSGIAKKHYGNAKAYTEIFEANKPMLKDPNRIYPGQVLRIPPQS